MSRGGVIMMTKADINRVARAAEHIQAARVILGNIKDEHLDGKNRIDYNEIDKDLGFLFYKLNRWVNELKAGE